MKLNKTYSTIFLILAAVFFIIFLISKSVFTLILAIIFLLIALYILSQLKKAGAAQSGPEPTRQAPAAEEDVQRSSACPLPSATSKTAPTRMAIIAGNLNFIISTSSITIPIRAAITSRAEDRVATSVIGTISGSQIYEKNLIFALTTV